MLDPRLSSPHNCIIEYLAAHPGQTAERISCELKRRFQPYTIQGVYRLLRSLEQKGIVLHQHKRYQLRTAWIYDLQKLTRIIERNYLENPDLRALFSGEKKKLSWKFSDLKKADNLWIQLMLDTYGQFPGALKFNWTPHPWFHLIHHDEELQYQRVLRHNNWRLYVILGNDTFLTRSFLKYWDERNYTYSLAAFDEELPEERYLTIVEDYIIEVNIGAALRSALDELFFNTSQLTAALPGIVSELISKSWKITVTISRNKRRARHLNREFASFFGLSIP